MNFNHAISSYFQERLVPTIFFGHLAVVLFVLCQLLTSNFVHFEDDGSLSKNALNFYGSWAHFIGGLALIAITLAFLRFLFKYRGVKHFFPYLFGNNDQIKADIAQLRRRSLPEPKPFGLAAAVQGLGLCALVAALLAALVWFIAWESGATWAGAFKDLHGGLTGLVIAYLVAHGAMGGLHIGLTILKQRRNAAGT